MPLDLVKESKVDGTSLHKKINWRLPTWLFTLVGTSVLRNPIKQKFDSSQTLWRYKEPPRPVGLVWTHTHPLELAFIGHSSPAANDVSDLQYVMHLRTTYAERIARKSPEIKSGTACTIVFRPFCTHHRVIRKGLTYSSAANECTRMLVIRFDERIKRCMFEGEEIFSAFRKFCLSTSPQSRPWPSRPF